MVIRTLHNHPLTLFLSAHYLTYRARVEQSYRLYSVYTTFLLCRSTIAELLQRNPNNKTFSITYSLQLH